MGICWVLYTSSTCSKYTDADHHPDAVTYPYPDGGCNCYSNPHSNFDAYSNGNTYVHANTDTDSCSNFHSHIRTNFYTNQRRYKYTVANSIGNTNYRAYFHFNADSIRGSHIHSHTNSYGHKYADSSTNSDLSSCWGRCSFCNI
jgi:hypothetical protein